MSYFEEQKQAAIEGLVTAILLCGFGFFWFWVGVLASRFVWGL